jgi:hypothetical protein
MDPAVRQDFFGRNGQQKQLQKHQEQETHGRPAYKEPSDYDKYNGYRERPYDRGRHYGYYNHRGHRLNSAEVKLYLPTAITWQFRPGRKKWVGIGFPGLLGRN